MYGCPSGGQPTIQGILIELHEIYQDHFIITFVLIIGFLGCVIMMSYALLAFMVLNGIMALIQLHRGNQQQVEQLTVLSRLMLYPAVFLLTIGIFLGAVWANVSWNFCEQFHKNT